MMPWIKVRCGLPTDPKVVMIAERTHLDRFSVVGRLHAFWAWADSITQDGNAITVTRSFINELVGCLGFAEAMDDVHWLSGPDGSISLPQFDEHNGQSSKKRSVTADRVKRHRDKKTSEKCNAGGVTSVTHALPLPLSSDNGVGKGKRDSKPNDSDFIHSLRTNPAYQGIDVDRERGKAEAWCAANKRVCSRRFFVNWLNKAERPLGVVTSGPSQAMSPRVLLMRERVQVAHVDVSDDPDKAVWRTETLAAIDRKLEAFR
jgi:hypothetical protein